ncbi:MAG: hypothetical protein ACJ8CN_00815 [Gemmatimonadales bacterium]
MTTYVFLTTDTDADVSLAVERYGPSDASFVDDLKLERLSVGRHETRVQVMSIGRGAKFQRDEGLDFELGLYVEHRFVAALRVYLASQFVMSDMYVSWRTPDERVHPFILPEGVATEYLPRTDEFTVAATRYHLSIEKVETSGADDIHVRLTGHANDLERRFYGGDRLSATEATQVAERIEEFRHRYAKTEPTRDDVGVRTGAVVHIDAWGEGLWNDGTPAAFQDGIINLNAFETASAPDQKWWPIPNLVKVDDYQSKWPLAKAFADRVTVRGAPIGAEWNRTVEELPRILRRPGAVQLFLLKGFWTTAITELMDGIQRETGGTVTKYEMEPPDGSPDMFYAYLFVE